MLYSVDENKNLTPSQIVMGNAEDFLTISPTTSYLTLDFEDNDSILSNVLYILSFSYHTTETVSTSRNFIQVHYTFGRNNTQFSGEMIITYSTLITIEPMYTWFSDASDSYVSGTNTTQLTLMKTLYGSQVGRANEPTYSGVLFLRLF